MVLAKIPAALLAEEENVILHAHANLPSWIPSRQKNCLSKSSKHIRDEHNPPSNSTALPDHQVVTNGNQKQNQLSESKEKVQNKNTDLNTYVSIQL